MKKIIETQRLVLREFLPEDATAMYHLNLDEDVIRYTGDPPFESVEAAADFLRNYQAYEKHGFGRWAILLKPELEFIGWCGLKLNEEKLNDLGFRLFKNQWSKGFATESARACIDYGFKTLGLTEIVGRAAKANKGSIRVLEKIGMTYWKEGGCGPFSDAIYYRVRKND